MKNAIQVIANKWEEAQAELDRVKFMRNHWKQQFDDSNEMRHELRARLNDAADTIKELQSKLEQRDKELHKAEMCIVNAMHHTRQRNNDFCRGVLLEYVTMMQDRTEREEKENGV